MEHLKWFLAKSKLNKFLPLKYPVPRLKILDKRPQIVFCNRICLLYHQDCILKFVTKVKNETKPGKPPCKMAVLAIDRFGGKWQKFH